MSKLKTNLLVGVVAAASVLTLVSCGGNNGPVSVDTSNGGVANNGTANTVKPVVVFELKDAQKPYVKGGATKDNLFKAVEITDLTSGKAVALANGDVNLVNGKVYVRSATSLKAGDKYKVTLYTVNDAVAQEANANPQEPTKTSMEFTVASGVTGTDQLVFAGPNGNTKSAGSFNFVGLSNNSTAVAADKIELVAHVKGKDQPVVKNAVCDAPSAATTGAQVTTCSFAGVNTDKDTKLTFKPAANSGLAVNNKEGKVEEKIKETTAKVVQSEVSYGKTDPKVSIRFSAPVQVTDVTKFFYNNTDNESAVLPVTLNKNPVKIEGAKDLLGGDAVENSVGYYFVPDFSQAPNVTFGSELKFETAKKSALKDAYGNEVKVDLTVTPTVHAA